jgi:hypothetical protein
VDSDVLERSEEVFRTFETGTFVPTGRHRMFYRTQSKARHGELVELVVGLRKISVVGASCKVYTRGVLL